MIVEKAALIILYLTFIVFAGKRLMTYMHVLQQEDYDNSRLLKWMRHNRAFDKRLSAALLVIALTAYYIPNYLIPLTFYQFLVFAGLIGSIYFEKDPRKNSKKKLVATTRAKRIFFPAYALIIASAAWCFYFNDDSHFWIWIVNVQAIPLLLILVNITLQPFEEAIQKSYWNEAHNKILDIQPKIIGITGSFGKTSVKHILGHILKTQAPTLITPGSVNTPMGITRIIREQLEDNHRYLVVEMGAYGPGSIERLCALTPPNMGIITSIGHAHYERFKSLDTVARTKFELADAVLEKDGKVIIHERTLRFSYPNSLRNNHPHNFLVCGEPASPDPKKNKETSYIQDGDLLITKIQQMPEGLAVDLTYNSKAYNLKFPLYGIHHGHNAALAFAAALELGIPAENIVTALKSLPQIEHRLEVRKQPDGTLLIDDAFNSNPVGFNSALGLLSAISKTGRKILITPGMVELGVAHDEAHEKIGKYAGEICDIALVISGQRIPTFIEGFKAGGSEKTLLEMDSFSAAQDWLQENKKEGDVILIENDLPDMYERIPKM